MRIFTVIKHNVVPPSSNSKTGLGGRSHWSVQAKTKGEWEGIFCMLLLAARLPKKLESVRAYPEIHFKTKAKRDGDNYYFPISKPLGDALVKGGWLPDDTPEFYNCERVHVLIGEEPPAPLVTSWIEVRLDSVRPHPPPTHGTDAGGVGRGL